MERTEAAAVRAAILDAGPIIHLDELGCLFLLSDFHQLLVPEAVWKEIEHHRPAALNNDHVTFTRLYAPMPSNTFRTLCEAFNLDFGEQEALSLCPLHPGAILFTDDAAVRLAAKTAGIRAHGTLGILLRAIRRKQLTSPEVAELLEQIPLRTSLFIRKALLQKIIEAVKNKR